jgi:hypothetical protein
MSTINQYSEFLTEIAEYEADVNEVRREEMYDLIDKLEALFGNHVYDVVMGNEQIFQGLSLEDAEKEYNFRCDPTSILF